MSESLPTSLAAPPTSAHPQADLDLDHDEAPPSLAVREPWWVGVSLRRQLVALMVVLLAIGMAGSGFAVQRAMSNQLMAQVDAQLRQAVNNPAMRNPRDDDLPQRPNPALQTFVVLYQETGGTAEFLSGNTTDETALATADLSLAFAGQTGNMSPYTVDFGEGETYRAIRANAVDRSSQDQIGTAVVMTSLHNVNESVSKIRMFLLVFGVLMLSTTALLGALVIRRAFAPLEQVERTAGAIADGDLTQRIPPYPPSTEVGRLTTSLNTMLTRIESAFRAREASEARTKRFAADASHELRTPLASIRGYAELYRQGAVPPQDVPRTMDRIENEAKRMGGLVEDLLLLARLDEQRPTRTDPVDLLVIAGDTVHDARALDPSRTVRLVGLDQSAPAAAPVTGDEDRLRQVVANLAANAVRHTPSGTPIEIAVGRRHSHSVIEVRDHGQGLSAEQAEKVFERFYRADASRQRGKGGGSGLGLSIVQAVVSAHGGTVSARPTPDGGATFVVSLPAS